MWPHIYLFFYLVILGYCGNAIKPAIYHHCLVQVNIFPEIGDVQINCRLFKLVTHGLYMLFKGFCGRNRIKISWFCLFDVGPSPPQAGDFESEMHPETSG